MCSTVLGQETAIIVVDVQNGFCPGGELAVPDGDRVVEPLNAYVDRVVRAGGKVVATRDWHPPDHVSFDTRGGLWPPHCVQGSRGAEFHPGLQLPPEARVVSKGADPNVEAYSAFQGTELASTLRKEGISKLLVGGLATDYCVKHTVLDALKEGFEVWVLADAIRAVDVQPGDGKRAIEEMVTAGARLLMLEDLDKAQAD